jgi:hypothetical protein
MNVIDQIKLSLRWKRTSTLLEAAAALIESDQRASEVEDSLSKFEDFLDHNELECAMNMLEQASDSISAPAVVWIKLAEAAASMELTQHEQEFLGRAKQDGENTALNTNH